MRPCKLHLGRKVSIYAFCGTLAAKVILINCENVFPSGKKGVGPDGRRLPGYFTDCFLYLWRHRQEVEDRNIKGYLYFAVHNRCLSCLRSKIAVQNLSGGDPVYSDEILLLFRQALGNMPEKTRRVFEASRQGELTYQQIAIKYGITVRQVSSEIQLALKTFRLALKDYLEIGR